MWQEGALASEPGPAPFVPGPTIPSALACPLPDDDEEWHLPPPAIAPDPETVVEPAAELAPEPTP